jgi:hypothetical protein
MKSIISSHTASKNEIITQCLCILNNGKLKSKIKYGLTEIDKYKLGKNEYIMTFVNNDLVSLECVWDFICLC